MQVYIYYYDITKNNKQIKNYSLSWDNYQLGVASRSRSENERAEEMTTDSLIGWAEVMVCDVKDNEREMNRVKEQRWDFSLRRTQM